MKSKTGNPANLVRTKEAADLLGVTAQTIKNYIYAGKLKSYGEKMECHGMGSPIKRDKSNIWPKHSIQRILRYTQAKPFDLLRAADLQRYA